MPQVKRYMAARNVQGALTAALFAGPLPNPGDPNAAATDPRLPAAARRHGVRGTPHGVYVNLFNSGFPPSDTGVGAYRWVTMKHRVDVQNLQVRTARPPSYSARRRCCRFSRRIMPQAPQNGSWPMPTPSVETNPTADGNDGVSVLVHAETKVALDLYRATRAGGVW